MSYYERKTRQGCYDQQTNATQERTALQMCHWGKGKMGMYRSKRLSQQSV